MSEKLLNKSVLGLSLLLFSFGVFAQDSSGDEPDEDEALVLEKMQVTGYHLKRIDIEGPVPVVVFEREDLEQAGIATIEEFARYLPVNFAAIEEPWGANGQASFDIRGIGPGATLTLVNGQRIAPFPWEYANTVDVNAIPVSAIDRIEILKDGASAIYGADAIAGVVNIILRTEFDGAEISAGYGVSEHGDADEFLVDLVSGKDFDRGGFMFSVSYFDRELVPRRARDWSSELDFTDLGGPNYRSAMGSPPTILRYDKYFSGAYSEIWEHDPECGIDPLYSSVGPSRWGSEYGTSCRFNWAQLQTLLNGQERLGVTLSGNYQFTSGTTFFGDFFFTNMQAQGIMAPAPFMGSPALPTIFGGPYVPAEHPNNPFGTDGELAYRPLDMGNRVNNTDSNSYRLSLGLEGTLGAWDWRATLVGSKSQVDEKETNVMRLTRFQEALLGMGGDDGNQWYNPFGFEPQNDPALVDWLRVDVETRNTSHDRTAEALVSRIFGKLPGGAIGLAVGAQYREQELDQRADEDLLTGDLSGGSVYSPVSGDRGIFSAYVEFNLPLHYTLEAQVALRFEDYSDFGDTTNPKIALRWQPANWIMLRGSWTTSFLAPDLWQLNAPHTPTLFGVEDTVRCEYTGAPEDCDFGTYPGAYGGNPDLEPEDGESWFAGLVWQPNFLPAFEFQLDFWKFKHSERIEALAPQIVLDKGWDLGITREPTEPDGTPGRIISVYQTGWNLETFETSGFDTTMRYSWQSKKAGDFQASLMHTYIDRWIFTESPYEEPYNYAGKAIWIPIPRNRANINLSWSLDSHHVALNLHYLGHYKAIWEDVWVNGERTDEHWDVPSQTTFGLQYAYTFEKLRNARLSIGCINCSGETPPIKSTPTEFAAPPASPYLDLRGSYWYLRWQQPFL